jgi:hypothetical protein
MTPQELEDGLLAMPVASPNPETLFPEPETPMETTAQLNRAMKLALSQRYPQPEFGCFFEVLSRGGRSRIDAVAVRQWGVLYGSNQVHGFEIKASRSDWLREIRRPRKSDEHPDIFDYWWLVAASKEIVKEGELPDGWGLLVLQRNGSLRAAVKAKALNPKGEGIDTWCSILTRAQQNSVAKLQAESEYERGRSEGRREAMSLSLKSESLAAVVIAFEEKSGIDLGSLDKWEAGRVGQALKVFMELRDTDFLGQLEALRKRFLNLAEQVQLVEKGESTWLKRMRA